MRRTTSLALLLAAASAHAGNQDCVYDQLGGCPFSSVTAQYDVDPGDGFLFVTEAADDFILSGMPGEACEIITVTTRVNFFNFGNADNPDPDPEACWDGVVLTVYEHLEFVDPIAIPYCNFKFGPAAWPNPASLPAVDHVECVTGGVVCQIVVPMWCVEVTDSGFKQWEITLHDLDGLCPIESDTWYWMSVAPIMDFGECGQTAIAGTDEFDNFPATRIFPGQSDDLQQWSPAVPGLRFRVEGDVSTPPVVFCIGDTDFDGDVDVNDLQNVILDWGIDAWTPSDVTGPIPGSPPDGTVDVNDLNAVILNWGDCPAPANDHCENKVALTPTLNELLEVDVDLRLATPFDPVAHPPVCVPPQRDVWYCVQTSGTELTVTTKFDVWVEIYEGCSCLSSQPRGVLPGRGLGGGIVVKACGWGAGGVTTAMPPGGSCCVRLVDAGDLPIHERRGLMAILDTAPPANDACVDRLAVGDGSHAFDSTTATLDPADPAFSCADGDADVWFNYTATLDGLAVIDTFGSTFDTVLEVYDGTACPPGAPLGCDDDRQDTVHSQVTVAVTAGQSLEIRIGGVGDARGPGVLNIACIESFAEPCLGSRYRQRVHEPDEPWVAWQSYAPGPDTADAFPWDGTGGISSIWTWGLESTGNLAAPCSDPAPTFDIIFYEDSGFSTPGNVISEHLDVPVSQRNPVGVYTTEAEIEFQGWQYKVPLPNVVLPPDNGVPHWISIRMNVDPCRFYWLSSPDGDGLYTRDDPFVGGWFFGSGDRAFCVNRD